MTRVDTGVERKMGDRVSIEGSYQHTALHSGNAVQRFWHASKLAVIDRLLEPKSDERILDIGCGSGVCAAHMARQGASVLGVDANPAAIEFARSKYGAWSIDFREGYVDELELAPGDYDKVVCLEVVEHLYRPQVEKLLRSVNRALRVGGRLLVTTPNYRSVWPVLEFVLDTLQLVPRLKDEQHVSKFHHGTLRQVVEGCGFHLVLSRSICTLGPWVVPISPGLARRLAELEMQHLIPAGTILAHLYEKRDVAE